MNELFHNNDVTWLPMRSCSISFSRVGTGFSQVGKKGGNPDLVCMKFLSLSEFFILLRKISFAK